LVEPTQANAKRLCTALGEFGYTALAEQVAEFATEDRMATLGAEPLRVDIMTSISGVSFRDAWNGRKLVRLAERNVPVIGPKEFVLNKRASGRIKDLLDIALLEEMLALAPKARRRN